MVNERDAASHWYAYFRRVLLVFLKQQQGKPFQRRGVQSSVADSERAKAIEGRRWVVMTAVTVHGLQRGLHKDHDHLTASFV